MQHTKSNERYVPIEDYGIIGNLHTVALVSLEGSIDFMSFPRFDSPTAFCKILDADKGGSFSVKPILQGVVFKQLYLPDTNILVTRFLSEEGIAEMIDYMPLIEEETECSIVRKVTTVRGNINYRMECFPAFNYARDKHTISQEKDVFIFKPGGSQPSLQLASNVTLISAGEKVTGEFALAESETAWFILSAECDANKERQNLEEYVAQTYRNTINYWQNWISQSTYNGRWQEMVHRSALTLKLLFSARYGSIVAAATFGLPESIGFGRNWDYRYTWIRDAAFSLHAFLELGFMDEAKAFLAWVKKESADKELQLMFAIDGETKLDEYELDHLEGYKKSKPVRVGNRAHEQVQMDIYGELLETIYIFSIHGGDLTYDYWKIIVEYINLVIDNWQKPDHSIWEVRGEKREFLFSRMMCWVAMDRGIKIARRFSFPYDILKWHQVRDEIYEDVYENFWKEEKQAYVQYKGADNVDASALLMPILSIMSPYSERWQKTMKAINSDLRSDVLMYRYLEKGEEVDGLKGPEGTFTMCSFWHVECLALAGNIEKAKEHFEKMLGYANHLGLFAEQLGKRGEHLGNFPQAFTHLALISAAIELSRPTEAGTSILPQYKQKGK
jgi:GH15 family glucan-1,4-alpha-glucosidase